MLVTKNVSDWNLGNEKNCGPKKVVIKTLATKKCGDQNFDVKKICGY